MELIAADHSLEWKQNNELNFNQVANDKSLLFEWLNKDNKFWDFIPDRDKFISEYEIKLAELKKLSGCSSCMINGLKNEYYLGLCGFCNDCLIDLGLPCIHF